MNTMAQSNRIGTENREDEPNLTPEQKKALGYLEGRRNSARRRVERIELAQDYKAGDTHDPDITEELGDLAYKSPDELAELLENASSWLGDISRTITEVEEGNMFLAKAFSNLEDERAKNQATSESR